MVVDQQLWLQRGVGTKVLQPEADHKGPVQEGDILILPVGRSVEVQSLEHGVDQGLDAELYTNGIIS